MKPQIELNVTSRSEFGAGWFSFPDLRIKGEGIVTIKRLKITEFIHLLEIKTSNKPHTYTRCT